MKIIYALGAVLFLASQSAGQVLALELCESQDYYNLMDSSKCKIKYNKVGDKKGTRDIMFEILKNYPYAEKSKFVKLLQRKIELVNGYIKQQEGESQREKAKSNISKLMTIKQDLSGQVVLVNAATQENWNSVRDQARKVLERAESKLQEIK